MINGIINIYKEKGYTSHDVVAKLRGILKQKKIGHTGTLDPDAEGVLPVCLGKATKLCDLLTDKDKVYETVLKLGVRTDTQDMTGEILENKKVIASEQEIINVIHSFIGDYQQIPPMYSALKVNGKKLYELAREGIEIERKPRGVTIHDIQIINIEQDEVRMAVHCSKGTYIRTLCNDIGEQLGCGGCMKSLLRTKVGQFFLEHSINLSTVVECVEKDQLQANIIAIDSILEEHSPVMIKEEYTRYLYNGNRLETDMIIALEKEELTKQVRVYDRDNHFVGLYEYNQNKKDYKPVKMFL